MNLDFIKGVQRKAFLSFCKKWFIATPLILLFFVSTIFLEVSLTCFDYLEHNVENIELQGVFKKRLENSAHMKSLI